MTKYTYSQNSFISGELSPKLKGRNDIKQYQDGLETMENMYPFLSGGATSRKGTEFLYKIPTVTANTKDILYFKPTISGVSRHFEIYANASNEYSCIEISKDGTTNNIKSTEITVLYSNTVITYPKTLQIGNLLFISDSLGRAEPLVLLFDGTDLQVHTYFGYISIVLNPLNDVARSRFLAHPLRTSNATSIFAEITTLVGTNGTITFSSAVELHVFGYILISDGANESVFYVHTKTSDTLYGVTEIIAGSGTLIAGYGTQAWTLSLWYFGNAPTSISLFQERLVIGGGVFIGMDTLNFSLSGNLFFLLNRKLAQDHTSDVSGLNYFGTIVDSDSFSVILGSDALEKIRWIKSDKSVQVGTELREHVISSVDGFLGPKNKTVSVSTEYGSGNLDSVRFQNSTYFVGTDGQSLRSLRYSDENGSNVSLLLSSLADHMLESGGPSSDGLISIQIHKDTNTIWALNSSTNSIVGLKIDDSTGILAWFKYTVTGADTVEAFSVMSFDSLAGASNSKYTSTPILVVRTLRGSDTFLEYITCSGEVESLTELNIGTAYSQAYTYMDFTHRPLTVAAGVATFDTHLANETLNFVIKGVDEGDLALDGSSQIDLTSYGVTSVNEVHIGLLFDSILKTMPIDQGSQLGNGQIGVSRVDQALIRFYRSKPCLLGSSESNMYDMEFPTLTDLELYTGDVRVEIDSTPGESQQIVMKRSKPYPLSILSIGMRGQMQD